MSHAPRHLPLSDDEYDALGALLAATPEAMDVSMLEGFLSAVALSPKRPPQDQWLAWIWHAEADPAAMPPAADSGQPGAAEAVVLALRHYHHLQQWLAQDPDSFEPIYHCGPEWAPSAWCAGFLRGMRLDAASWEGLNAGQPALFEPMRQLAGPQRAQLSDEETQRWMDAVAPAVIALNALLSPPRPGARGAAKVGRNDPCPCGSGKKYKKCCGGAAG